LRLTRKSGSLKLFFGHHIKLVIFSIIVILAVPFISSKIVRAMQTADEQPARYLIVGRLIDAQAQPVIKAHIEGSVIGENEPIAESESQDDGSWQLGMNEVPHADLEILISEPHFHSTTIRIGDEERAQLLEDVVILLIATETLHSTTAALAGFSAIFLVSYIGGAFNSDLYIFDFEQGLSYINWEVIFLILGMMILIAVIENTGIFQWMAFQAYRLSRGRVWVLSLILMAITAVASALLDNFTTMLLITPITLQISFALGINPLALIIPEVLASNVGGISTLVGTPTNILIGAYAGISFTDFLVNQTGGVILALIGMSAFILFYFRKDYRTSHAGISPVLYKKLEQNAHLDDPEGLWKSGLVFIFVLIGFVLGEQIHLVPAVPAIVGATVVLIWLKPDVQKMIKSVDWTTLVFFMTLFVVVGAIQEVGLLSLGASAMSRLIGEKSRAPRVWCYSTLYLWVQRWVGMDF
jgi:Na+/H+ antiporter NhaD/arsenite permease-like protein